MEPVRKTPRLVTLAASLVIIAAMYVAKGVLIPFALAVLVSFFLGPLVARLHRWKIPRPLAVLAAVMLLLVPTVGVGALIVGEARDLAAKMPEYRENTRHKTGVLREIFGKPLEQAATTVKEMGSDISSPADGKPPVAEPQIVRLAEPVSTPFQSLRDMVDPVVGALTTIVMALLFAVVMLLRPEDLRDRFIRLVGSGQIYVTTQAIDEASQRVSRYLIRQLFVNGLLGVGIALGLMLIGVPDALLWGFLFMLLRFIPYVGVWIAASIPFVLTFLTSDGWSQPIETIGVYLVVEAIGSFAIEPWLYGAGTGISPLAILLSALFWGWLWGPVGLVLATPLTVCLVVMGKYVPQLQFLSFLFSDSPALPPPARLYQRLLAQDQDDAWNIIKTELAEHDPHEVLDSTVLPALSMAEKDLQSGALDAESATQIHSNVRLLLEEVEEAAAMRASETVGEEAPSLSGLRILCLPARSAADVLAAGMLGRMLAGVGSIVEVAPMDELLGETLNNLAQRPADIVLISAVPPSRFLHVRYICKRLAKQVPGIEIIVGLWTLDASAPGVVEQVPAGLHIHVVSSLAQALQKSRQLAGSLRIVRNAAS